MMVVCVLRLMPGYAGHMVYGSQVGFAFDLRSGSGQKVDVEGVVVHARVWTAAVTALVVVRAQVRRRERVGVSDVGRVGVWGRDVG